MSNDEKCPIHGNNICILYPLGITGREHMTIDQAESLEVLSQMWDCLAEEVRSSIRALIAPPPVAKVTPYSAEWFDSLLAEYALLFPMDVTLGWPSDRAIVARFLAERCAAEMEKGSGA